MTHPPTKAQLLRKLLSKAKEALEPEGNRLAQQAALTRWNELGERVKGFPFRLAQLLPRDPDTKDIYGDRVLLLETSHWCDMAARRLSQRLRDGIAFGTAFDATADELVNHALAPWGPWRRICLLTGVMYSGDPVHIGPGVHVVELHSLDDLQRLIGDQEVDWPIELDIVTSFPDKPHWTAIIYDQDASMARSESGGLPGFNYADPLYHPSTLLLAFRLYSEGEITIAGELDASMATIPYCRPMVYGESGVKSTWDGPLIGPAVALTRHDIDRIVHIYHQVNNMPNSAFGLATSRFGRSYEGRGDDAIVDLTISLEALSCLETSQELAYRLCARWASLLAPTAEFATVYRAIKTMYDVRSTVVHGSNKKLDKAWNALSEMRSTSPGQPWSVPLIGETLEVTLPAGYMQVTRALLTARQVVRLALRAVLTLGNNSSNTYCWPFPKKRNIDIEIIDPLTRDLWRKQAGVEEQDPSRTWWNWPSR